MKVGDRVKLRSGGPVMTVEGTHDYEDGPLVHCVWHDRTHRERRGQYPPRALKLVPEDQGPPPGRFRETKKTFDY